MDRKKAEQCIFANLMNSLQMSANSKIAVVVSDISIKNQVATLIAYIHIHSSLSSRLFIMQLMLLSLRPNFLLLGMASIKLHN